MTGPSAIGGILLFALLLGEARPAMAHAFLRRYDLPLPLWYYIGGAGLAVACTFAFLAVFRGNGGARASKVVDLSGTIIARVITGRGVCRALAALSVTLFGLLMSAGVLGAQGDPSANILPTFIRVGWWVGFAFLCALVGNVWPAVNPWAVIASAAGGAMDRRPARSVPLRLGVWPAVVLFIGFAWAELVWSENAMPASLAMAVLLYSVVTWAGMVRYGTEQWLRCGETFSLVFELFGRFAPVARKEQGRIVLRPYGGGFLSGEKVSFSMVVFIVTLLATVSFDGFLHTPAWRWIFSTAFHTSYDLGLIDLLGNAGAGTLILTIGLIAAPLIFLAVFLAICASTAALSPAGSALPRPLEIARLYALTLVPIAIAYHLSHYFPLLMIEGQRLYALVSDPFGFGWDLFGTAGIAPDIEAIDARFIWLFAVLAIVTGHVFSVWLAHRTALRLCDAGRWALVSQLPMVTLMIGYTMLSLWILAQPIVQG